MQCLLMVALIHVGTVRVVFWLLLLVLYYYYYYYKHGNVIVFFSVDKTKNSLKL